MLYGLTAGTLTAVAQEAAETGRPGWSIALGALVAALSRIIAGDY